MTPVCLFTVIDEHDWCLSCAGGEGVASLALTESALSSRLENHIFVLSLISRSVRSSISQPTHDSGKCRANPGGWTRALYKLNWRAIYEHG